MLVIIVGGLYSYGVWPRAIYDTSVGIGSYELVDLTGEDTLLEQTFQCGDLGMCGLDIKISKNGLESIGTYKWVLKDVDGRSTVEEGIINDESTENRLFESSNPQKQGTIKIEFPRQANSKGKEYLLIIKPVEAKKNQGAAAYVTARSGIRSKLEISGKELDKACIIKIQYLRFNLETFIVFMCIAAYLMFFIKFIYKLFR